jgi:myo-inositol 2-dehydrogenase/D-chiro-inositol 1-dehydrogenase
VADAVPEAALAVSSVIGAPVLSIEELLAADDVDTVAICTSTDTHVGLIIAAAEAGKAIFCEKPVSLDLEQVDRALAAVEAAGVPFMIGFNRRFDPGHKSVRDRVADGSVGDLHVLRITSRDPCGAAAGVRRGERRDLPRHGHPRLRHGELRRAQSGDRGVRAWRGPCRPADRRGRRRRHGGDGPDPRGRHADDDRQQPRGGLRLRPAGRGVRQRRHGGLRQPGPARGLVHRPRGHGPTSRCRGSSSTATWSPTARRWAAFHTYLTEGGPSPVGTADARHCTAVALAAGVSLREDRPVQVKEVG